MIDEWVWNRYAECKYLCMLKRIVCFYVYLYMYAVCVLVYVYKCMHAAHTWFCKYMMYVCVYVRAHICAPTLCSCTFIYLFICVHLSILYVCMRLYEPASQLRQIKWRFERDSLLECIAVKLDSIHLLLR